MVNDFGEVMIDFEPFNSVEFETWLKEKIAENRSLAVEIIVNEALTAGKLYPLLNIIEKSHEENVNLRIFGDSIE